jgi:hypothetical protein
MTDSDEEQRDLNVHVTGHGGDGPGGWQQQQLLPEAGPAPRHGDRPSDRLRRAGLLGIAQAREALAEAARRARSREESRAA